MPSTGMASNDPPFAPTRRREVLWFGSPAPKSGSVEACQAHGLTLRQVSDENVEQRARSARALLLPIPNESATYSTWCRRVTDQARRHGQLVASVFQTDARPGDIPPEEDIR